MLGRLDEVRHLKSTQNKSENNSSSDFYLKYIISSIYFSLRLKYLCGEIRTHLTYLCVNELNVEDCNCQLIFK